MAKRFKIQHFARIYEQRDHHFSACCTASAVGIQHAGARRRGQSDPDGGASSEAYAAALLQRARRSTDLNSFITIDENAVLEAANDADKARAAGVAGPLLGVPIGVKDSYLTAGLPTSLGLASLGRFIPREDADAVRAIKRAGAIVFGKNNLVELSYGLTGHNERYGQARNPHAVDRVTGGSSSGSAAAVAPGLYRLLGRRYGRFNPRACILLCGRGFQANYRTLVAPWRSADIPYARHDRCIRSKRRGLHFIGSGRDRRRW
jgi:hypothetical protein